jgi:hypothetical protein
MKMSSRAVTILVALGIAFGGVIVGLAQNRPIVGGYKTVSTDDPEVVEAAEFAVSERSEKNSVSLQLVSVERAERQVVAGTNFKLCLKVAIADEEDDANETQDVQVVVFRSLQKEYSLKSWDVAECGESQ